MYNLLSTFLAVLLALKAVTCGTDAGDVLDGPPKFSLLGLLKMPSEGDRFVNQGGAMGDIQVVYTVPQNKHTHTELGAFTIAIDVTMVPRREAGFNPGPHDIVLARGLRPTNDGNLNLIKTNFVPPMETCGDYRMVITETQIFNNVLVQVKAGAPGVAVDCSPLTWF